MFLIRLGLVEILLSEGAPLFSKELQDVSLCAFGRELYGGDVRLHQRSLRLGGGGHGRGEGGGEMGGVKEEDRGSDVIFYNGISLILLT